MKNKVSIRVSDISSFDLSLFFGLTEKELKEASIALSIQGESQLDEQIEPLDLSKKSNLNDSFSPAALFNEKNYKQNYEQNVSTPNRIR